MADFSSLTFSVRSGVRPLRPASPLYAANRAIVDSIHFYDILDRAASIFWCSRGRDRVIRVDEDGVAYVRRHDLRSVSARLHDELANRYCFERAVLEFDAAPLALSRFLELNDEFDAAMRLALDVTLSDAVLCLSDYATAEEYIGAWLEVIAYLPQNWTVRLVLDLEVDVASRQLHAAVQKHRIHERLNLYLDTSNTTAGDLPSAQIKRFVDDAFGKLGKLVVCRGLARRAKDKVVEAATSDEDEDE